LALAVKKRNTKVNETYESSTTILPKLRELLLLQRSGEFVPTLEAYVAGILQ
jgi:hypothetical protein